VSGRFDAIVVGAGPAGSVAALVLARGGARVALVDRSSFPRDKACGDVVGPRGVRLLERLGVNVPEPKPVPSSWSPHPAGRWPFRGPPREPRTWPARWSSVAVTSTVRCATPRSPPGPSPCELRSAGSTARP
jgi:choline dehydrogenase-like flavoprotein